MHQTFRKLSFGLLTATFLIVAAPSALAGNPDVSWSITVGSPRHAAPVYAPPPVVYVQPQPVYVQPRPVYVQPATVVHYGAPVYVYKKDRHHKRHWKHRHHYRHHHYDY